MRLQGQVGAHVGSGLAREADVGPGVPAGAYGGPDRAAEGP